MKTFNKAQKEEKVIVLDLQTGDYSSFTTLDGIFDYCLDDLLTNYWGEDSEALRAEYENPTDEKKRELVAEYEYRLLEPTPKLVEEWEEYHCRTFFDEGEIQEQFVEEQSEKRFSNLSWVTTNDFEEDDAVDILLYGDWGEEFKQALHKAGEYNEEEDSSHIVVFIEKTENGLNYSFFLSDGYSLLDTIKFTQEEKTEILSYIIREKLCPKFKEVSLSHLRK